MSFPLVRFCVFSEERKGCRMFHVSYMNNVLLYFGKSYIRKAVKNGSVVSDFSY